jgi:hypothetical protein
MSYSIDPTIPFLNEKISYKNRDIFIKIPEQSYLNSLNAYWLVKKDIKLLFYYLFPPIDNLKPINDCFYQWKIIGS